MLIFKLLQSLLLPSVFVLVFFVVGLLLIFEKKKSRKKVGRVLLVVGVCLFYLLSVTPVADVFLDPLELQHWYIEESKLDQADQVVILLGGADSFVRADQAIRIYNLKEKKPEIIISGKDPLKDNVDPTGKIKEYLVDRGLDKEKITLEDQSETTYENAKFTKEIVEDNPFFLITSAFHMPRALETFEKLGANPIPAPSDFKGKHSYSVLDLLPSGRSLHYSNLAFHEYFGILYYRLVHY